MVGSQTGSTNQPTVIRSMSTNKKKNHLVVEGTRELVAKVKEGPSITAVTAGMGKTNIASSVQSRQKERPRNSYSNASSVTSVPRRGRGRGP